MVVRKEQLREWMLAELLVAQLETQMAALMAAWMVEQMVRMSDNLMVDH